jgi:hypothetical protein
MNVGADPIFVHAWWRSGSTYVWSKLRQNDSCLCYYEPLHEKMARFSAAAIDQPPDPEQSRFFRHPPQTKNYLAEYAEPVRSDSLHFSPTLSYDRFLLQAGKSDEELRRYIDGLVTAALAAGRRPVLCFCRSQMRSAWMKQAFGGIHVAQIRNPSDQWASFGVEPYFRNKMLIIALKLHGLHPNSFAHIEAFDRFARNMATRPSVPVQQMFKFFLKPKDILAVFLLLWIASALQATSHADFILDIDLLSVDAGHRRMATEWFDSIGCSADFSDCASPTANTPLIPATEFDRMLDDAVTAIRSEASSLVISEPGAIKDKLASLSSASRGVLLSALGRDSS